MGLQIGEQRKDRVVILSPAGRIDNDTSPGFQTRLLDAVGKGPVLVDLAAVEYISSAGLRALMMAAKQAKTANTKVVVAGLQPVVKEIFDISRFSFVVQVFGTTAEALTALG